MIKQICDACGRELHPAHYLMYISILTNDGSDREKFGEFCPKCFMDLKNFLEDQAKNWIKSRVRCD